MGTTKQYGLRNTLEIYTIIAKMYEVSKYHIFKGLLQSDKMFTYLDIMNKNNRIVAWYDTEDGELLGILMYDFIEDWYSTDVILVEQLVLQFGNFKGFQRLAIEELENIAKIYEIKYISCGNYLTPDSDKQMVANGYTKKGYSVGYNTFLKEIHYD